ALLGQEEKAVLRHRRVERRAPLLPVRQQLAERARVHHRARKDVRADLRSLLEHADADRKALFFTELAEPDCSGEAGRTAPDDDDIEFHALAFHARSNLAALSRSIGGDPAPPSRLPEF